MRDLVSWYLVELRRRLRGVGPQQRVEDFLLETRAHLNEAIDEMTARGVSEEAATTSAIADFGHPGAVVAGFKGRHVLSPLFYWTLVVSAIVAIASVSGHFLSSAGGVLSLQESYNPFEIGFYILMFIGFAFLLGLVWRRWAAVPITVGALVAVATWGTVESRDLVAVDDLGGGSAFMTKPMLDHQARLRDDWLTEYRDRVAGKSDPPSGHSLLKEMRIDGQQLYPYRIHNSLEVFSALPSGARGRHIRDRIVPLAWHEDSGPIALGTTTDSAFASAAWSDLEDDYFAYTERVASRLTKERGSLESPQELSSGALLRQTIGRPLLLVMFYGLLALLANALAISLADMIGAFLRHGWRRSLA